MTFLLCRTNEENFDELALVVQLLGTHESFMMLADDYNDFEEIITDDIEVLKIV